MPGIRAGNRQVVSTRPSWPTPVLLVVGDRLIHGLANVRCSLLGWTGRVGRPIPEGKEVEAKMSTPLAEVPRNPCCPLRRCQSLSVCRSVGSLRTRLLPPLPGSSCHPGSAFIALSSILPGMSLPPLGWPPLVWQLLGSQCSWLSYTGHHV